MKRQNHACLVVASLIALLWKGAAAAQSEPAAFVPFDEFVESVSSATFGDSAFQVDGVVEERAELERMRAHILSMYKGVEVEHSYVMGSQHFDCVPVEQQPSVRLLGLGTIAVPPAPLTAESSEPGAPKETLRLASPLTLGLEDAFGNAIHCDPGTIPMRRVTLEEMSGFGSLEGFFQKTPFGREQALEMFGAAAVHKYAHAYQKVKNYGGNSWLNVWSPPVNESAGQIFSLSQHWYAGGKGKALQTVEGGWQVYPAKYRTSRSALFIYWTADAYTSTGCYNLDCVGFVQINNKWPLGGNFANESVPGGEQRVFQMQWRLTGGNWWLYLQGIGDYEPVGYYPGSIFKRGQLTKHATTIDYGGETVGTSSYPPMGSGAFANEGFGHAAFQNVIFYISSSAGKTKWAALKSVQSSPKCYTLKLTPSGSGGSWGTYFFFGGAGGGPC